MKTLIVTILLSSNVFALESMSSVFMGSSSVDFNSDINAGKNIYFGMDGFFETKLTGLEIGIGYDYLGFNLPKYTYDANSNDYTLAIQLKLGYSLEDLIVWPVCLKTSLGYGVSRMYKENSWGYQYDIALESKLYKSFGVGVKYKYVDTGSDNTLIKDYTASIAYARFVF